MLFARNVLTRQPGASIIFDVKCEDSDMKSLFVTDDVWGGDSLAFLIETEGHAYYQVEVNPDGKIFDADREIGCVTRWKSQASTETEIGKDFWRIKLTIPIVTPENNAGDPYHYGDHCGRFVARGVLSPPYARDKDLKRKKWRPILT